MKKYIVSFEIASFLHTLQELQNILNLPSMDDCKDLGESGVTVWRVYSLAEPAASIEDHFQSLLTEIKKATLDFAVLKSSDNVELYLNVACMFDTANCSVLITRSMIELAVQLDAEIEITTYVTDYS
ncbi:hypothetical protein [Singulisphaera acidiphila]|uniref:DUF4279 domain-containing protein n=1 Tax=Singulisphaera acidiphila (strain ATCC BAA-1392 / DSM 18658 / VKM B-2454 / MOB10) TaxID=886293 RepID=L0D8J7_SINAD|nr:hypothetical protein [Singulisphaera acidiphila]AGA25729.1 hypothetical protein Sinac_1342 [Singulisphaera acidiphila DSM 18658]